MQKTLITLISTALSVLFTASALSDESTLQLDDFTYGSDLTSAETEFRRFTLTPIMIKHIQRRDLGDVRVFDGSNELMPMLITRKNKDIKTSQQTLTIYPYKVSGSTRGYILDHTAKHKQPLKSLLLQWKRGNAPKILSIRVEQSADKKTWKTLKDSAMVNNFNFNRKSLKENSIDINNYTQRYIRLTYLDSKQSPALASVKASTTNKRPADYVWIPAGRLEPYEGLPHTYHFSVSKGINPDFIKLSFGKLNTMLSASLSTLSIIDNKPQRKLAVDNFDAYAVTYNNNVVRSKPIDVSKWQSVDWLVTIKTSSNLEENGLPSVMAAYPEYEVIFANDGEEPYIVTWGNSNAGNPVNGDIPKRIKASGLKWKDIAVVTPSNLLDTDGLSKLMESRTTPWLMLIIGLLMIIAVITASVFGFKRYQSTKIIEP